MNIQFKTKLSFEEKKLLNNEFEKHANQHEIKCNYQPFNFIAKEQDKILGFITGASVFDGVYVDELIVIEEYRSKGIGTKLIKQVEDYCRNKQIRYIELCTNEFQARPFYEKLGFKLEYVRQNKEEPKLTKYFLIKYFKQYL